MLFNHLTKMAFLAGLFAQHCCPGQRARPGWEVDSVLLLYVANVPDAVKAGRLQDACASCGHAQNPVTQLP